MLAVHEITENHKTFYTEAFTMHFMGYTVMRHAHTPYPELNFRPTIPRKLCSAGRVDGAHSALDRCKRINPMGRNAVRGMGYERASLLYSP